MWHFLEHDYDPLQVARARARALKPDGRLVIEVPRLDSVTFRLFGDRWPGLQAPQHTALYDRKMLLGLVGRAGFDVVDYCPYGAFPPYFYLFCGRCLQACCEGRGLNLRAAIYPYFAGQLLLLPVLPLLKRTEPRHADGRLQEDAMKAARHDTRRDPVARQPRVPSPLVRWLLLPIAAASRSFAARRLYAAAATRLAGLVLRIWGIRMIVHQDAPFPREQTVYISNHTSTLDLFILVALGLPNTRFFLSGFLQKSCRWDSSRI